MLKSLLLVSMLTIASTAIAGFRGYNSTTDLKLFHAIKCNAGMTCSRGHNGVLELVSSPTITAGAFSVVGIEGGDSVLTLSADESDDSGDDWLVKSLASDNSLVFYSDVSGSAVAKLSLSTAGDMILAGTTPYLTLGDAGAEDAGLAFDGNAQDFNISLDDSTDDLVIGLGVAAGTTDAIRIDENQDVTFVQNVLGLGTDSISGFLQKRVLATATTLTAAQCGSSIYNGGAIEIELPEASAVLGCRFTFITANAANFDIDPDAADQILVQADAAGDKIRNATLGNSITIEAVSASQWVVVGILGTWADAN